MKEQEQDRGDVAEVTVAGKWIGTVRAPDEPVLGIVRNGRVTRTDRSEIDLKDRFEGRFVVVLEAVEWQA